MDQQYRVYFINFGYAAQELYASEPEARTKAKDSGFESRIERLEGEDWVPCLSFSPISGFRRFR